MNTNEYKEELGKEKENLLNELKLLGIQNPKVEEDWIPLPTDVTNNTADENIVADHSEDWQERRGTLDVLETRLNNINLALKKISEDTFGICELCKKEIEKDRLEVNPAARTCKEHLNEEANLTE